MYTQKDSDQVRGQIIKYCIILAVLLAVVIAGFVVGIVERMEKVVMVTGPLMFAVICFMWAMFIYPNIKYALFLRDMRSGLAREMAGTIIEVSQQEDLQDGVRVLPVRVQLRDEDDERIVYLNVSKKDSFPAEGTPVRLNCYGRHIKEVLI